MGQQSPRATIEAPEPQANGKWPHLTPPKLKSQLAEPDAIRVDAYTWNGKSVMLNPMVEGISWRENAKQAAVEATITFDNDSDVAHKILTPGTWIRVRRKSIITGNWIDLLPWLYIWERSLTDLNQRTAEVEAFDVCSFLMRAGKASYLFRPDSGHKKGWTATAVARFLLREFDVPAIIAVSKHYLPFLMLENVEPYEVLVKAFGADRKESGIPWRIRAGRWSNKHGGLIHADKVVIEPVSVSAQTYQLAAGDNLESARWSESLDNTKTEWMGISVSDSDAGKRELHRVRVLSAAAARYGRLRLVEKMPPRLDEAGLNRHGKDKLRKLRRLTRKANISAHGFPEIRAADAVRVAEAGTRLDGTFFVGQVAHRLVSGVHTMDAEISDVANWPSDPIDPEQINPPRYVFSGAGFEGGGSGEYLKVQGGWAHPTGGRGNIIGTPYSGTHTIGNWQSDRAIDIGMPIGSAVYAAHSGTIQGVSGTVDHSSRFGGLNFDLVGGPGGEQSFYTHMEQLAPNVRDGAQVVTGQFVGTSGAANGVPHLHYAMKNSNPKTLFGAMEGQVTSGGGGGQAGLTISVDGSFDPIAALPDEQIFAPGELQEFLQGGTSGPSNLAGGGVSPVSLRAAEQWPGDGASEQVRAQWMAGIAANAGLPAVLPVMAAIPESSMQSQARGDGGEAVGLFQVHPDRWREDMGTDPSNRLIPKEQMRWFIGEANKHRARYYNQGPPGYPAWIQAFERSANASGSQYAEAYDRAKQLLGIR